MFPVDELVPVDVVTCDRTAVRCLPDLHSQQTTECSQLFPFLVRNYSK